MREIKIGSKYKHYKGNEYLVIDVANHSETLEKYVVYKALYGEGKTWIRPLDMFLEKIEKDGNSFYRFEEIED